MATRTATIVIEVQDKSLQELNTEIKALESSIQGLKVGTQDWVKQNQKLGELKTKFSQATHEAQKLQQVVEKVGSAEQLRSIAKLGQGIVGSFAGVQGAVKLLGGSSEAFDEIAAKGVEFLTVMQSLNAISETFSKENLKGLKNVGLGFGQLVRSVKSSSLAMKSALISTGIGALIVGVGLLIANFDKIKNVVGGFNRQQKKAAEEGIKNTAQEATNQETIVDIRKKELDLLKQTEQASGKTVKTKQGELVLAQEELKLAIDKLAQQEALSEKIKTEAETTVFLSKKKLDDLKAQYKASTLKEIELQKEVDIAAQKKIQAESELSLAKSTDELNKSLQESNDKITRINAELYNQEKLYKEQRKNLEIQIELLIKSNNFSREKLEGLKAQLDALDKQEVLRKKELETNITLLKIEQIRNQQANDYRKNIDETNLAIQQILDKEEQNNYLFEKRSQLFELLNKGFEEGRKLRDETVNFDRKGNQIYEERTSKLIPSEVKLTKELFLEVKRYVDAFKDFGGLTLETFDELGNKSVISLDSMEAIGEAVAGIYDKTRQELELNAGLTKEYDKRSEAGRRIIDDATQELVLIKLNAQVVKQTLDSQKQNLEDQRTASKGLLEADKKIVTALEGQRDNLADILDNNENGLRVQLENAKNDEQRYDLLQKIASAENELANINSEILATSTDINAENQKQVEYGQQIDDVNYKIVQAVDQQGVEQEKVSNELENQLRLSQKLNDFLGKYAKEIEVAQEIIQQGFELTASLFDRQAEDAQAKIDALQEGLDKAKEEQDQLVSDDEKHQEKLLEYQDELKDANGERYDELLALIADEKAALDSNKAEYDTIEKSKADNEKQVAALERKKLLAEHRAAVWRKTAAIIDAVIAGAVAVVKALPNIVLAVLTGVLAAVGVATIAAKKVPDVPAEEKAEGGLLRGPSHKSGGVPIVAEGNEFIVNKRSTQKYLPLLESINNEGRRQYADGGVVPANSIDTSGIIDYDRMSMAFLNAVKTLPNPQVSVLKITESQRDVAVTKKNAGI